MKSSSHRLVATCETLHNLMKDVKAAVFAKDPTYELLIEELPALDVIFPRLGIESEQDPFIPYPTIEPRPAMSEVCMFLHSSGSTGLPSTIPQTHESLLNWAATRTFISKKKIPLLTPANPASGRCESMSRQRIAGMHLPPFHTLGFMIQVVCVLRACRTVALYPPVTKRPDLLPIAPTPQNILDHTQRTKSKGMFITPSIIEVWSHDPKAVDFLKSLEYVVRGLFGFWFRVFTSSGV
jgi:acyl-CoA synthetase (AMP-forming)/AMP-acid ligase II